MTKYRSPLPAPEQQTCNGCGRTLPISEFYGDATAFRGVKLVCKECYRQHVRLLERFRLLKAEACETCGATDRLCADHVHGTDLMRGTLCRRCNLLLGHAHDDPDLLEELASYVRRHRVAEAVA